MDELVTQQLDQSVAPSIGDVSDNPEPPVARLRSFQALRFQFLDRHQVSLATSGILAIGIGIVMGLPSNGGGARAIRQFVQFLYSNQKQVLRKKPAD